jgi:hypothetical protein
LRRGRGKRMSDRIRIIPHAPEDVSLRTEDEPPRLPKGFEPDTG